MCLLKVYLESEESERKLVARDVSLVSKEDGKVIVRDLDFNTLSFENTEIRFVDALNSMLVLARRKDK